VGLAPTAGCERGDAWRRPRSRLATINSSGRVSARSPSRRRLVSDWELSVTETHPPWPIKRRATMPGRGAARKPHSRPEHPIGNCPKRRNRDALTARGQPGNWAPCGARGRTGTSGTGQPLELPARSSFGPANRRSGVCAASQGPMASTIARCSARCCSSRSTNCASAPIMLSSASTTSPCDIAS
jgi:hypothetical protein